MTNTIEFDCPMNCTEAGKNHQLVEADRADYECVDCGMNIYLGDKHGYQKTLDKPITAEKGEKLKLGDSVNCKVIG